jgi:hypothetical protein
MKERKKWGCLISKEDFLFFWVRALISHEMEMRALKGHVLTRIGLSSIDAK